MVANIPVQGLSANGPMENRVLSPKLLRDLPVLNEKADPTSSVSMAFVLILVISGRKDVTRQNQHRQGASFAVRAQLRHGQIVLLNLGSKKSSVAHALRARQIGRVSNAPKALIN